MPETKVKICPLRVIFPLPVPQDILSEKDPLQQRLKAQAYQQQMTGCIQGMCMWWLEDLHDCAIPQLVGGFEETTEDDPEKISSEDNKIVNIASAR